MLESGTGSRSFAQHEKKVGNDRKPEPEKEKRMETEAGEAVDVRNRDEAGANQSEPQRDPQTWLEARWMDVDEARKLDPGIDLDEHATRIGVVKGDRKAEGFVEVYGVVLQHVGNPYAPYSDHYTLARPIGRWRGGEAETVAGLPAETRAGHDSIDVYGAAPNPEPRHRFNSKLAEEDPYVEEVDEPGTVFTVHRNGAVTESEYWLNEAALEEDVYEALKMANGETIPENCDMDPAAAAHRNLVAVYTERGNLVELAGLDGTIVHQGYRPT